MSILIPIENVDYGYREKNVCWFMKAGTCKIHRKALIDANGYNPFDLGMVQRGLRILPARGRLWPSARELASVPESRGAVIVDLDLSPRTREECAEHSRWYFGHDGVGPTHISYNLTDHVRPREQVARDGWRIKDWHFERLSERHREIIDFLVAMPAAQKRRYAQLYGMNWVNKDKVTVLYDSPRLCHLQYQWFGTVD